MSMDDTRTGLYGKYEIRKAATGELVTKPTFTLSPESDPAALAALRTYAANTPNHALQADLLTWIRRIKEDRKYGPLNQPGEAD